MKQTVILCDCCEAYISSTNEGKAFFINRHYNPDGSNGKRIQERKFEASIDKDFHLCVQCLHGICSILKDAPEEKKAIENDFPLVIKICDSVGGFPFPYGHTNNLEWLRINKGTIHKAKRLGMNYYMLQNGVRVHIYNGREILNDTISRNEGKSGEGREGP